MDFEKALLSLIGIVAMIGFVSLCSVIFGRRRVRNGSFLNQLPKKPVPTLATKPRKPLELETQVDYDRRTNRGFF